MRAEDYFNELARSIKNISSKADLLMFEGAIKKSDWDEIMEDVLILHLFHMGVFKEASPILKGFLEKLDVKEKLTKDERKQLGAFFTPPYIAEYIVDETIGKFIDDNPENIEKICDLKICDPAMGGAIFLVCAHDFLMNHLVQIEQSKYSIKELSEMSSKTLFGIDINPRAVEFSKMILNLNIAKWSIVERLDEYVTSVEPSLN